MQNFLQDSIPFTAHAEQTKYLTEVYLDACSVLYKLIHYSENPWELGFERSTIHLLVAYLTDFHRPHKIFESFYLWWDQQAICQTTLTNSHRIVTHVLFCMLLRNARLREKYEPGKTNVKELIQNMYVSLGDALCDYRKLCIRRYQTDNIYLTDLSDLIQGISCIVGLFSSTTPSHPLYQPSQKKLKIEHHPPAHLDHLPPAVFQAYSLEMIPSLLQEEETFSVSSLTSSSSSSMTTTQDFQDWLELLEFPPNPSDLEQVDLDEKRKHHLSCLQSEAYYPIEHLTHITQL